MSNSHAFLAPSSAGLTVNCHAAPLLQQPYPDDDTPATMEGTAAHWVMAQMILGIVPVKIGTVAPNGVAVSQEMIEGAEMVHETVHEQCGDAWLNVNVEHEVRGVDLHPSRNFGTPDVFFMRGRDLHIIDYKFGHGFVDEYENWQCINYASLILDASGARDLNQRVVHMTIVQPRCYVALPVRTWSVQAVDLVPYWDRLRKAFYAATEHLVPYWDPLRKAFYAATELAPVATPGPWCNNHYCRARHACPALQRSAYFAAEEAYRGTDRPLTPDTLGVELRILHEAQYVLNARIDALEEQALSLMAGGKNIPHYMMGRTQPHRKWSKAPQEVIALGNLMGLPLTKPPEPITPAQALKAGIPDDVLKAFAETPPGTPKLVRDTKLQARRVFSNT